ncbi:MAG: hypothetical protein WDO14_02550 [Bacteroidota bacterium]
MNNDRYEFITSESHLTFEFQSDGPKGKIKKIVNFRPYNVNGRTYFNLAFGDWNEESARLDDMAVSNNHDTSKILATVAAIALKITEYFPDIAVAASGSSQARTRLYQMAISANLNEIEKALDVYGWYQGSWEPFTRNINYEAFSVKRKQK